MWFIRAGQPKVRCFHVLVSVSTHVQPFLSLRKYKLYGAFFSATMVYPVDAAVQFEISIGRCTCVCVCVCVCVCCVGVVCTRVLIFSSVVCVDVCAHARSGGVHVCSLVVCLEER